MPMNSDCQIVFSYTFCYIFFLYYRLLIVILLLVITLRCFFNDSALARCRRIRGLLPRFLTPNFEAFSVSAILQILKLINASKTHFRLTIQNYVAKYENHGVNQRQAITANKHNKSTLSRLLLFHFFCSEYIRNPVAT